MKRLPLLLFCFLAGNAFAQYGQTPTLCVDGKYLKDTHGNVVNLHGVMDTPNPYFNSYRWGNSCDDSTVDTCLAYFESLFTAITDTAQGAYCDIFRLHLDPCWTNDPELEETGSATGEANISRYSSERLSHYLDLLYVPLAKEALAHGLYVVMRPPGVCPDTIQVGGDYQDYLLNVWSIVASNDSVKKYCGQISLELANEPITCLDSAGEASATALHDFFQPIADTIRACGFAGILWIPGTDYQSNYETFALYPIDGYNIGYAVHTYPGWYGADDDNCDADAFISQWGEQVPVAETNPILISETDWSPVVSTDEEGNTTNYGTWGTASTSKWGAAFKTLLDYYGNISMTLTGTADYIDIDTFLVTGKVTPAFDGNPECCAQACFEWYADYAQYNKPTPEYSCLRTADNGDGTYTNPLIHADFPDPDIIRVDNTYYLVSTTMFYFPGATILKSYDLVNWEYCANPLEQINDSEPYNLENGYNHYSKGQWAASLKYHNGTFYLHFIAFDHENFADGGDFLLTATDPEGDWEMRKLDGFYYDSGLLFDGDDIYIAYGIGDISVTQLDDDFNALQTELVISVGNGCEGSHFYHIGDYYYIYATYGGTEGSQTIFRSTSPFGPYEEHDGRIFANQNIHQGGLVQTQTGEWWTILFKDDGTVGRIPYLEPVVWQDNWPILGNDGIDVSAAGASYPKPNVGAAYPKTYLPTNDTFTGTSLGMQWEWNHNPDNASWSIFENPGFLRLHTASVTDNFKQARNTLTQRAHGYANEGTADNAYPDSYATACLDVSGMTEGDICGLCVFQDPYGYIGVQMTNGEKHIIYYRSAYETDGDTIPAETITSDDPIAGNTVYLRATANFGTDKANFFYSTDNTTYTSFGNEWTMRYTLNIFVGNRFCLFNYATKTLGGYIDIDWFSTEPDFSETKYFNDGTLTSFTEEDLTMSLLTVADTDVCLLPGDRFTPDITATFLSGRTDDVAALCTYTITNNDVIQIDGATITALADGTAEVTASYTDYMGNTLTETFTVTVATFPLTEEMFNPSIYSTGTFDEETLCLITGQYGFGGWEYENGIDISAYNYIVVQLQESATCWPSFRLFDENNYWSTPYECDMDTSVEAVIDLQNMEKSDGTLCDPSHIYIAGFWTLGSSPLYIKNVFLSDDGTTPTAVLPIPLSSDARDVQSTTYYSVSGQMLPSPQRGINIVRRVSADGSTHTTKEIF